MAYGYRFLDWFGSVMSEPTVIPWRVGLSEPAARVLHRWHIEKSPPDPDVEILQTAFASLRLHGIPVEARKIRATIALFKLSAGNYNLTLRKEEVKRWIIVERVTDQRPEQRYVRQP